MVYIIFDFEFFIRFLPPSGPQQVVAQWRLAAPYSSLIFRRNITFFQQTRYKSRITLHYQLYHILSLEGGGVLIIADAQLYQALDGHSQR